MKIRSLILTILALGLAFEPARGTTLVRLSLDQLYQASTDIVQGSVVSQQSRWNDDHTQIFTLTTIAVEESMKGHTPQTVVVEQLGGTVGDTHVQVAATVVFRPEASYVLFLEPAGPESARFALVGMVQGCYRIYRDATTEEGRVILPLGASASDVARWARPSGGTLSLREFRQRLSATMNAPIVIPPGTSIPVTIRSSESRGVARVEVLGRTTVDLYPSPSVVIPTGSAIEGTARRVSGQWKIHWTEISIRDRHIEISTTSEEPADGSLRGRALVVNMR